MDLSIWRSAATPERVPMGSERTTNAMTMIVPVPTSIMWPLPNRPVM